MLNQFSRTELLFGKEAMKKLAASRVVGLIIAGEVIKDLTAKLYRFFA